ncbi:MAG: serine--tRNA ligase, partial [Candidatus Dadabacteria bacterium]
MIDLKKLRANPEPFKRACEVKRVNFDVDAFLALDETYRRLTKECEDLRSQQNRASKEIPKLQGEEKAAKISEMKEVAGRLKKVQEELSKVEEEWKAKVLLIPSVPDPRVPEGEDESDNVEIRRWGKIRSFEFTPRSHIELGERLGIIDIKRGVKVAGTRNYFLKGDGALLQ